MAGEVAQVQGTVHRASMQLNERISQKDETGAEVPGEFGYLLKPKSFLIVGQLNEFVGPAGGHNVDKVRSFELYRRNLGEPEIITFDELLARANWIVESNI